MAGTHTHRRFDESQHRRSSDGKFAHKPVLAASAAVTQDVRSAAADLDRDEATVDAAPEIDETVRERRHRAVEERLGYRLNMSRLDDETAAMMNRRFGITTDRPSTLAEEAERLGISRFEVRKRESAALARLRADSRPGSER